MDPKQLEAQLKNGVAYKKTCTSLGKVPSLFKGIPQRTHQLHQELGCDNSHHHHELRVEGRGGEGKYFGQGSKYFPPPLAYFFQIFLILLIFSTSRGCFWPIYLPLAKRKGEHHGRTLSSSYPCLSDPVELVKRKQPNGPRIAFSAPKH